MHFGARRRDPPGCCGGDAPRKEGSREAVKTTVKPLASPPDSAIMNCVEPSPDSLFGDIPDLDSGKAAEIAKDRGKVEKP